jgi:hypothetical protein
MFKYKDKNTGKTVYANGLFENYVYSKNYTYLSKISIFISESEFNIGLYKLVRYLNIHGIILGSYVVEDKSIEMFCLLYNKDTKKVLKLLKYLKELYSTKAMEYSFFYEKFNVFDIYYLQKSEFISAYAVHLSKLSRILFDSKNVLLSLSFYFNKYEKMQSFYNTRNSVRVKEVEDNHVFVVSTSVECKNNDFDIENIVSSILFESRINEGIFIKINIYNIK